MHLSFRLFPIQICLLFLMSSPFLQTVSAQSAPSISYTTPQLLARSIPITAISPTNGGGAVPAGTYTNVSVLAGSTTGYTDATGTSAKFKQPTGMTIDGSGNLYVVDCFNHCIRKVTPAGVVTTLAGDGFEIFGGRLLNGNGTAASFNYPTDIAIHPDGSCLYVADKENNVIRRISLTSPYAVTTFAGPGTAGFANHASDGTRAQFWLPEGIAYDGSGATHYLYVADRASHRIRRIQLSSTSGATATAGAVTTFAGTGTASAVDAAAASATFNNPVQVAVSSDGTTLYVADLTCHTMTGPVQST
jgi:DNA-binding beta-propeller fold protein YncE